MSNELKVVVDQTPGVIRWNFDELKAALRERMSQYAGMVYDETAITTAKADVAMLRKLRKAVEDRRKEINRKCLEPYKVIEAQAKELTALIDEPIGLIDKQVKDYEAEQKRLRREKILAYMDERFAELPPAIAAKAKVKAYDARWENATAKEKDWKAAVDAILADIRRCIDILEETDEEFRDEVIEVYTQDFNLCAAMERAQDLEAQKRRVLAAERQRKEREEEARREREEAERHRAEQEERTPEQAAPVPAPDRPVRFSDAAAPITARAPVAAASVENAEQVAARRFPGQQYQERGVAAQTAPQTPNDGSIVIRLYGTPQEQKKALDYIGFIGVRFERL